MAQIERIGKYQITEVVGRGAMGVVYKAFDPNIRRTVAIKTIRVDGAEKATPRRCSHVSGTRRRRPGA
jgi:serine/threonine-protein kinase